MKYIRSCPTCSMELRFPLDMGILIITCPNCKTSFRMDPDDPRTYQSGTFDLSPSQKKSPYFSNLLEKGKNYFSSKKDIHFLIPVFLVFILLLNLIKIFQSTETVPKPELEEKKIQIPKPEMPDENLEDPPSLKPSVEI